MCRWLIGEIRDTLHEERKVRLLAPGAKTAGCKALSQRGDSGSAK
jgi:hypothetical protein